MCHTSGGPVPQAIGPARVVVADATLTDFDVATPHHRFTGNLLRDTVT